MSHDGSSLRKVIKTNSWIACDDLSPKNRGRDANSNRLSHNSRRKGLTSRITACPNKANSIPRQGSRQALYVSNSNKILLRSMAVAIPLGQGIQTLRDAHVRDNRRPD